MTWSNRGFGFHDWATFLQQGATVHSTECFWFVIMLRKRLTTNYDRYLLLKAATHEMTNDPPFKLVIEVQ